MLSAADDDFIEFPRRTTVVIDGLTGVPVEVTVGPFMMAKTEVTQKQYAGIMGNNPSVHKGDDLPVENVSWWDAIIYCNLRSEREGLEACYDTVTGACDFSRSGYRLPTEAEWSYADSSAAGLNRENILTFANLGSGNTKSLTELDRDLREKGTTPPGTYPPNHYGIQDMLGNVWEWCFDYANPERDIPIPFNNSRGPSEGVERVIRGGSFMSMTNSWSRGYRSSMKPEHSGRFTGFRVVRSLPVDTETERHYDDEWYEPYNRIPDGYEHATGSLSPLLLNERGNRVDSLDEWKTIRSGILDKWTTILGDMPDKIPAPHAESVRTFTGYGWTGKLMYLDLETDFSEKILVLMPDTPIAEPAPVVIVPYYDVDVPAGMNLGGRSYRPPSVRSFAELAAREGFIAVAVRWFGESYGEHYGESVANLRLRHPNLTGLGKWVWDARRLIDFIDTMPEADHDRIGIIGHSLGGKMALYAAAFDERITVAVSSELGIGLGFSNYDDFWYFGDFIGKVERGTDHHELLALIAPRPFLLIGGDEYDTNDSWYYINAAREVYGLYNAPRNIGYYNHRTGHTPSPESVKLAFDWLKRYLLK